MANRSLTAGAMLCGFAIAMSLPASAAAQCLLCDPGVSAAAAKPRKPIAIEIETRIDFSIIGLIPSGTGGAASIDPVTGQRTLSGGVIDLGGIPVTGTVTIRGEPKEHVRVDFPATVLIYNSSGASYPLSGFTTTLKNNPKLGDDGTLRFTFGATLRINANATGTFRGSVPVTVEYR